MQSRVVSLFARKSAIKIERQIRDKRRGLSVPGCLKNTQTKLTSGAGRRLSKEMKARKTELHNTVLLTF